jgi:hypothetical protein
MKRRHRKERIEGKDYSDPTVRLFPPHLPFPLFPYAPLLSVPRSTGLRRHEATQQVLRQASRRLFPPQPRLPWSCGPRDRPLRSIRRPLAEHRRRLSDTHKRREIEECRYSLFCCKLHSVPTFLLSSLQATISSPTASSFSLLAEATAPAPPSSPLSALPSPSRPLSASSPPPSPQP